VAKNKSYTSVVAGCILLVAAIGSIVFITHHPTIGAAGFDSVVDEVVDEAAIGRFVHGVMILFALSFWYAMSVLSDCLGSRRPNILAAQLIFTVATFAMTGAALVSGFVAPGLAEHYAASGLSDDLFCFQLLLLWESNQALADLGAVCYAMAMVGWSLTLLGQAGVTRLAGVAGCLAGPVLGAGILTGYLHLDVHGMGILLTVLTIWFCAVAVQLIRGELRIQSRE
jgi:hypothetical protein